MLHGAILVLHPGRLVLHCGWNHSDALLQSTVHLSHYLTLMHIEICSSADFVVHYTRDCTTDMFLAGHGAGVKITNMRYVHTGPHH